MSLQSYKKPYSKTVNFKFVSQPTFSVKEKNQLFFKKFGLSSLRKRNNQRHLLWLKRKKRIRYQQEQFLRKYNNQFLRKYKTEKSVSLKIPRLFRSQILGVKLKRIFNKALWFSKKRCVALIKFNAVGLDKKKTKKPVQFFKHKRLSKNGWLRLKKSLKKIQWYDIKNFRKLIFGFISNTRLRNKTQKLKKKKRLQVALKRRLNATLLSGVKLALQNLVNTKRLWQKINKNQNNSFKKNYIKNKVLLPFNKKTQLEFYAKLQKKTYRLISSSYFNHLVRVAKTLLFSKTRAINKLFFSKTKWQLLFFRRSFDLVNGAVGTKPQKKVESKYRKNQRYFFNRLNKNLLKVIFKQTQEIPYYLRKRKKKKNFLRPRVWSNFFAKHDYLNLKTNNRQFTTLFLQLANPWVTSKKCKIKIFRYINFVDTRYFPKCLTLITETWRPQCRQLFQLIFKTRLTPYFKKNRWNQKSNGVKLNNQITQSFFSQKFFLSRQKLAKTNWVKLRRAHRFGHFSWNKKTYFLHFAKYLRWLCEVEDFKREVENSYVPFKFQHTQKNPRRYYQLSRWDHKANRWLTPVAHLRKLSWWQLYMQITKEKRHPHRYKSYKIYKWFLRTMSNKWNYGMRAKKNYRLKQIMFGRIILPALDYLSKNQFLHIKNNVAKVKPLGLQNSRPAMFLGKFERRIDILTYKLNFAPTIQWARSLVRSGLVYVSYLTFLRTINYQNILVKKQSFPLHTDWNSKATKVFDPAFTKTWRKQLSVLGRWQWNMPLAVTLPSYLVRIKGIVHWSSKNVTTLFYRHFCNRYLPRYFIYNREQTIAYFWRNLRLSDIDRQRSATRMKWNTMKWLL